MPQYGFDHTNIGVLAPFSMSSLLGGSLFLLPSPEGEGWLTWGFNPYDPGGDQYSQTEPIETPAAIMRVPVRYVGDGKDPDNTDDFVLYLLNAARTAHEALQQRVDDIDVQTIMDAKLGERLMYAYRQLANVMGAIEVLNQVMQVDQGADFMPFVPMFGNRYKVEFVSNWLVVDLLNRAPADDVTFDNVDDAQTHADVLNEAARLSWVQAQFGTHSLPNWVDEVSIDKGVNVRDDVIEYMLRHGYGWGDVLYPTALDRILDFLYPRPKAWLEGTTVMFEFNGIVGTAEPDPPDMEISILHDVTDYDLEFAATPSANWLHIDQESETTFTVFPDVTGLGPGQYNGDVRITEARGLVKEPVIFHVTLVVAPEPQAPAPEDPPIDPPAPVEAA